MTRRRSQRFTMTDIAREAAVSTTTVSRFINGEFGNIAPDTRRRLESVVERLGYRPNPAARTLRSGRSGLIGVVLSNLVHPYWSDVMSAITDRCGREDYVALISGANDSVEVEEKYIGILLDHRVDGLIINSAAGDGDGGSIWSNIDVPVVALDRRLPQLNCDLVAMDNVTGAKLAVRHLIELGHTDIALASWETQGLSNREERVQGYLEAMAEAQLPVSPATMGFGRSASGTGVAIAQRLFGVEHRPTAVFCTTAMLNLEVIAGLRACGLSIPEDVSVVGFDDAPWDPLLDPPLTTVATPARRLGDTAVSQLLRRIKGSRVRQREVRLSSELVVRRSTRKLEG